MFYVEGVALSCPEGPVVVHGQSSARSGAGPRHLDWIAGKFVFVLNELSCTVSVLEFNTLKEVSKSTPDD